MNTILHPEYIECRFSAGPAPVSHVQTNAVEVYFSETATLRSRYPEFLDIISDEEKIRARKFASDENRETYVCSHAVLRLILSRHLNTGPSDISFITGKYSKPFLMEYPVHFNISHTGNAFAIAVSEKFNIGIDIEQVDTGIGIRSIAGSYFSKQECDYILQSEEEEFEAFFLLWTRKESLLKALGTGIADNLTRIEVSEQCNRIDIKSFEGLTIEGDFCSKFLCSMKIKNYYISIASAGKSPISLTHLLSNNIGTYLIRS